MSLFDFELNFDFDRPVRILQLSDIQVIDSEQQRFPARLSEREHENWLPSRKEFHYKECVRKTIETYKPDFIFTVGDNVYGEFDDSGRSQLDFTEFMDSFGIPWSPIYGNHDNESLMGADWQSECYENAHNCLFRQNSISGNSNYNVLIKCRNKPLRAFWFVDSNACGAMSEQTALNGHSPKIVGMAEDQITWLKERADEIKALYPDIKFSFATHVQLNVFAKRLEELGLKDKLPHNFDLDNDGENFGYAGTFTPGWDGDERVFNMLRDLGFDSIFVGHEHQDSYSVVYKGVRLTFGQKSSSYDKINYFTGDEANYSATYLRQEKPVWGGTVMELDGKGGLINMGLWKV